MSSLTEIITDITKIIIYIHIVSGTHLSFLVPDSSVEVLALQAQEVVAGLDDAALGGDGARRVDVVARHHAHRDARPLALPDGLRDLGSDRERR